MVGGRRRAPSCTFALPGEAPRSAPSPAELAGEIVRDIKTRIMREALDAAGYHHAPATEESVRECFMDYVDSGYWSNLTADDVDDDIHVGEMCRALIGRRRKGAEACTRD